MASPQRIGTLDILNTALLSNELSKADIGSARELLFISEDASLTGVVTLQSAPQEETGSVWATVQSPPGTDITLAAGKAVVILSNSFPRIRLSSTLAEGGARSWEVWGVVGS